ncbi:alpha/beta fold hydrolase [Nocardia iowensis]|uniref:Alpha/beta hydrolase n=1 Tax=Nocardia iowensis TaxID=204891 RepID=A0ABX8S1T1_NOCIO|nr:alpha/beta hydrolase [Nocardia iowensis]QXN94580.1 alpha/beta hydrolase [Nocardia iowensis]
MIDHQDACPFPVVAPDGARLSAVRIGSASAPASVVYVHGMFTDASYWKPLVEHLHHRLEGGIAQICYDQRGHGSSDCATRETPLNLEVMAGDLAAVLDHVDGAVVLAAHSVAALLVQEWAGRNPARARALSGIVLFNACAEFPYTPVTSHEILPGLLERRGRYSAIEELSSLLYTAPPSERWLPARKRSADPSAVQRLRATAEAALAELSAYPPAVLTNEAADVLRDIPTWVLAGQRDPVVTPSRSQRLAEQIWADYDTIPGAGHSLPHVDPGPASESILAALEVAYRAHRQNGVAS